MPAAGTKEMNLSRDFKFTVLIDNDAEGSQTPFAECIRNQHLREPTLFMQELQGQLTQTLLQACPQRQPASRPPSPAAPSASPSPPRAAHPDRRLSVCRRTRRATSRPTRCLAR